MHACRDALAAEAWDYAFWREHHLATWVNRCELQGQGPHSAAPHESMPQSRARVAPCTACRAQLEAPDWDYAAFRELHLLPYVDMTQRFVHEEIDGKYTLP